MIGQSIINIKSGGRGRLSGVVASVALLLFILFGSSYIEMIPIAALVGVMFMVVFGTFAWSTFKVIGKIPWSDLFVILLVTILTVFFDLAIAVFAGVIVAALVLHGTTPNEFEFVSVKTKKELNTMKLGSFVLWITTTFLQKFDVKNDPSEVIIDFKESRLMDQSAIEAINKVAENYLKEGKTIHLRHLSKDCTALINKAQDICDVNVIEDPDYFLAIDNYKQKLQTKTS